MVLRAIGVLVGMLVTGCGAVTEPTTSDASTADGASGDGATGDSTADGGTGDGATGIVCGTKRCAAGEVCTRTYTTGGPCLACGFDDAGECPTGMHCSGSCCTPETTTYTYACKPLPASCAGASTCDGTCGNELCAGAGCPCEDAFGPNVTCHCLAP